jgi:hypothetical protein
MPEFAREFIFPKISDDSEFSARYWLDGKEISHGDVSAGEGPHEAKVEATDKFGNVSVESRSFVIDATPPQILVKSQNNTKTSDELAIEFSVSEENLSYTEIILSDGTTIQDKTDLKISTTEYAEGKHHITISAYDRAGNSDQKTITFEVVRDKAAPSMSGKPAQAPGADLVLLAIIGAAAIGGASAVAYATKKSKRQ